MALFSDKVESGEDAGAVVLDRGAALSPATETKDEVGEGLGGVIALVGVSTTVPEAFPVGEEEGLHSSGGAIPTMRHAAVAFWCRDK